MTLKLTQKTFLNGNRKFEVVDDAVYVEIKTPFRKEKLTVGLSTLQPEPVFNKSELEFRDRVRNEVLLSLIVDKPNTEEFSSFVEELTHRIREESNAISGISLTSRPSEFSRNVYEEPPEFTEINKGDIKKKNVRASSVEESIMMLKTYLVVDDIADLLSALSDLQETPQSEVCLKKLGDEFDKLGPTQGAILTYAPYLSVLLADDPFGD